MQHQPATLELLEFALFDVNIGVDSDHTGCRDLVVFVPLQLAVSHFERGTVQNSDARHFLSGLDPVEGQNAVLQFERARLEQYNT